jgi:hypothetical protein
MFSYATLYSPIVICRQSGNCVFFYRSSYGSQTPFWRGFKRDDRAGDAADFSMGDKLLFAARRRANARSANPDARFSSRLSIAMRAAYIRPTI